MKGEHRKERQTQSNQYNGDLLNREKFFKEFRRTGVLFVGTQLPVALPVPAIRQAASFRWRAIRRRWRCEQ
jgi:hypothetical protein